MYSDNVKSTTTVLEISFAYDKKHICFRSDPDIAHLFCIHKNILQGMKKSEERKSQLHMLVKPRCNPRSKQ
ncbi:Protein of unknown function [Gryllus bimaculatus]|nr:Protein of unknown function [Gryllus bimaculatus]